MAYVLPSMPHLVVVLSFWFQKCKLLWDFFQKYNLSPTSSFLGNGLAFSNPPAIQKLLIDFDGGLFEILQPPAV